jgi:hypothetical protein
MTPVSTQKKLPQNVEPCEGKHLMDKEYESSEMKKKSLFVSVK